MSRKITCMTKDESLRKYKEYVCNHIADVHYVYKRSLEAFQEVFPKVFENMNLHVDLVCNISDHDRSKIDKEEFEPYAAKFYPVNGEKPNENEFKEAWLHHIHNNQHHPAHWCYVENGNIIILDMPDIYIIEMLCDWMAMSIHFKSTTLDYWKSESAQKLPMSEYTKSKVNEFMNWLIKNNKNTLW